MSDSRFGVGLSIVIVSMVAAATFGTFLLPQNVNGVQVLVKTETSVSTQTAFLTTVATTTISYTYTQTVANYTTVTQALPRLISLSGSASTGGIGTTATSISFVGQHAGNTVNAQVSGGQFSTQIPNGDIYSIKIGYSSATGGGSCNVGSFILDTVTQQVSASFSC